MATQVLADPVLSQFRAALAEAYGDRIERVVLYGPRARGDARAGSDYDVAVFLHGMTDWGQEANRLADICTDVLYEAGRLIHAIPHRAGAYRERTPLMHEVRQDGIDS